MTDLDVSGEQQTLPVQETSGLTFASAKVVT